LWVLFRFRFAFLYAVVFGSGSRPRWRRALLSALLGNAHGGGAACAACERQEHVAARRRRLPGGARAGRAAAWWRGPHPGAAPGGAGGPRSGAGEALAAAAVGSSDPSDSPRIGLQQPQLRPESVRWIASLVSSFFHHFC